MIRPVAIGLAAYLFLLPSQGLAADAPAIKTTNGNAVPACVTPGRLTAFLKSRNPELDQRFEKIAVEYMRRGEELALRWDYAFYQMLLETGSLTYRGDAGRRGDVSAKQYNFAGLGATGGGNAGESFPDLATGVLAHLQHVQLYAGDRVANPVAERTRKVQEWGVLDGLRKKRSPITFVDLAKKWAPGSSSYVAALNGFASKFNEEFCGVADPNPELVAEARGLAKTAAKAKPADTPGKVTGAELARRAIEDGKANNDNEAKGLGAVSLAKPETPAYSVLNRSPDAPSAASEEAAVAAPKATPPGTNPAVVTASAPASIAPASIAPASIAKAAPGKGASAVAPKCQVWTASYGGHKALIIRVRSQKGVDYTVLDVNDGAEKREADAYISAYAKGGEIAGEFSSQTQALDKAFELCPEN